MEFQTGVEKGQGKFTLVVYFDLLKTSYRYFIEYPSVTVGELIDRMQYRNVQQ
jgi:hypothetical protein